MIYASDFRKGITFEINGEPHVVLDFQHVKPGKGAAFVRTKYKNILTGATREEAFNPEDKFPKAHIETRRMQYLYNDGDLYYFMDPETYDQVPLPFDQVEDAIKFMDSLRMICIVTHVADARTCVLHPASHTHRQLSDEQLIEAGVAPDLIRLSVGIEDVEDILADIRQALDKV